ncbi:MAG: ABC transporter permease [Chloroflexi bacterium]|nr:ABC transporter permease [Chloroflexota bacterium]
MAASTEPIPELLADRLAVGRDASLWRDTLGNVLRQRSAVIGLAILAVLVLTAIFADVIATHDPELGLLNAEPGVERRDAPCIHVLGCPTSKPQHLLGTDGNFRDVFSRLVHGARISLQVGFLTVGFAILIGAVIGATAGYVGGFLDNVLMRLMDVLLAFPSLLLAIAILAALGPGLLNAQLAIGIVAIPIYARVMRAAVLSVRDLDYVTASRALGESSVGLLVRRVVPNSLTPMIVQGTLGIGVALLDVAALSFLGLAAEPKIPEWGAMIGSERNQLFSAPHLILAPGFAITLVVLGFNLLGDGLRDALDPRLN